MDEELARAAEPSLGMNGWQQSAAREMEDDAVAVARRGYRVASSTEVGIPAFGVVYDKVTYELD